ncbi:portal protein [Pseudochrobactrum sp. sp1633]|uniref:portal protein n=1 Tax=Pseudochrobactrum sp. sp1633 TaxID=3036706 RepID=UPI0025A65414|nr:portal protein [Pseudochrobactrum sp. sp1633]MDM8346266.1 portal protein [Pseudochrobactrum sp. sp1633]
MGIADDIMRMQQQMAVERYYWEATWRDVVTLCMPYASHKYELNGMNIASSLTGTAQQPQAAQRSKEIFDATAAWSLDRLNAGMESLIAPRAQKWHAFSLDDPFSPDPTDLEEEWLDRLRDYHFTARYDAKSNFALANQKAIRGACGLGTGVLYLEENIGRRGIDTVKVPFFYRSIPVVETYLGIDAYDDVDKCIRVFELTARAAEGYFSQEGDSLPEKVKSALTNKPDQPFTFIHCVMPREEAGEHKDKRRHQPYASFWLEVESRHLIRSSGFFTFPYQVMWWDQTDGSPYGQSPVMAALSEIKMLQVMGKTVAQVSQQMIKPPMATMRGIYNQRLNLNAGAVNAGMLDEQGRLLAQPIIQAQNPTFAERLIEAKRLSVRESMYINLFQTMVDNPQMTATEALLRANEKGELLGPAGAKIETGIAGAIDREVDIVQRKGAFEQGSPLEPPSSVGGKNVGVKFTGPLARMRRMAEMQGIERVLQMATVVGEYDRSTLMKIDGDETLELTREINGAPRKMFKRDEEVAEQRQAMAQQQESQAALAMMQGAATAAKDATPAMQAMAQANGMMPG